MSIKEFIEGRVTIRIKGYNLARLMRQITGKHTVYGYRIIEPHLIEFKTTKQVSKTVIAFCKEMCYNVEIIAEKGLWRLIADGRKRLALYLLVLMATALLGVFNSLIWDIQIEGNSRVLQSDILKTLDSAGISTGIFKAKISPKSLENLLTLEYPDISMVQVKTKGVLLKISVVETLYKDDVLDRSNIQSVRASGSGRVNSVIVYQGTALVSVGDYVAEGEELIAGYEDRLMPDGITAERLFMKALGEVDLTVYYTHEETFSQTVTQYVRTGKSTTTSSLSLMGLKFFKRGNNPYQYSEGSSGERVLFKNSVLPIKKYQTVIHQLKRVEVQREYEKYAAQLEAQALFEARLKVPNPEQIISQHVDVSETNGNYRITGVVAVREVVRAE